MNDIKKQFNELLDRFFAGDEQAARELYDRFGRALRLIVRCRLDRYPLLRTQYDSLDFVQSVFAQVLLDSEKMRDFDGFKECLNYLSKVADHKIEKTARKHLGTKKRDLRRVRHLSSLDALDTALEPTDPRPAPDQEAESRDEWNRWLDTLPLRDNVVARMLRDGFTYQEIAQRCGCSTRTIERIVAIWRSEYPLE